MTCREPARAALLVVLLVARGVHADPAPAAPAGPPVALDTAVDRRLAERLLRLGDHHYRTGAYYRAISAYQELALFTGDDATRRYAAIRIAMSYHRGRQLDDALAAYRTALGLARDPATAQALRIQRTLARVERSFEEPGSEALDAIAAELVPSTADGAHRALALLHLARVEAAAGRRAAARRTAGALRAACSQPAPGCSVEPILSRALTRPPAARRAPWLGVAMSLVVPGSGSVYGGHLVDGLYAFAFTTLSGLGALEVHRSDRRWTDQPATFYGLAALAAIFYAGGAVQGYVSVARRNTLVELDARHALWRDTDLPLPLEDLTVD
jgi:tetratricopeptide (TPR) repeat protein